MVVLPSAFCHTHEVHSQHLSVAHSCNEQRCDGRRSSPEKNAFEAAQNALASLSEGSRQ